MLVPTSHNTNERNPAVSSDTALGRVRVSVDSLRKLIQASKAVIKLAHGLYRESSPLQTFEPQSGALDEFAAHDEGYIEMPLVMLVTHIDYLEGLLAEQTDSRGAPEEQPDHTNNAQRVVPLSHSTEISEQVQKPSDKCFFDRIDLMERLVVKTIQTFLVTSTMRVSRDFNSESLAIIAGKTPKQKQWGPPSFELLSIVEEPISIAHVDFLSLYALRRLEKRAAWLVKHPEVLRDQRLNMFCRGLSTKSRGLIVVWFRERIDANEEIKVFLAFAYLIKNVQDTRPLIKSFVACEDAWRKKLYPRRSTKKSTRAAGNNCQDQIDCGPAGGNGSRSRRR